MYNYIVCYVTDYICHVMMCTGKYIRQLATRYVWPTTLAGGSKIDDTCRRGTAEAEAVLGVSFDVCGCRQVKILYASLTGQFILLLKDQFENIKKNVKNDCEFDKLIKQI